jgi:hypothetical protein
MLDDRPADFRPTEGQFGGKRAANSFCSWPSGSASSSRFVYPQVGSESMLPVARPGTDKSENNPASARPPLAIEAGCHGRAPTSTPLAPACHV